VYKAAHELCQGDNSVMFRTRTTNDLKVFGLRVSSILSGPLSNNVWLACVTCILNDAELKVLNVNITWIAQLLLQSRLPAGATVLSDPEGGKSVNINNFILL
jgi:hypothetical protein